jgi:hypothetical protein
MSWTPGAGIGSPGLPGQFIRAHQACHRRIAEAAVTMEIRAQNGGTVKPQHHPTTSDTTNELVPRLADIPAASIGDAQERIGAASGLSPVGWSPACRSCLHGLDPSGDNLYIHTKPWPIADCRSSPAQSPPPVPITSVRAGCSCPWRSTASWSFPRGLFMTSNLVASVAP